MMKTRRERLAGFGLIGVLGAALSGCGHSRTEADGGESSAPRTVAVTVAPIEQRDVERTIDVVGSLRGWEQVSFGSKRGGRVVKIFHDMGDRVKPGEPLMALDPVDAQLALSQAEAKYLAELVRLGITSEQADQFVKTYGTGEALLKAAATQEVIEKAPSVVQARVSMERAQQNLARQRALTARGAGTQQELDDHENTFREAAAAYENARYLARNLIANALTNRVALEQARQALKETVVRAPEPALLPPGVDRADQIVYGITKRTVAEGQMIREGETVAELVIEDPVRLWASVPERYSGRIKAGQAVRVSVPSRPDSVFTGSVARINPSVDVASRTFQIEALLPNDRKLLRPGGFAKASIVTEHNSRATVVPLESVVEFAGVTKVFVVRDGRAHAVSNVVTGVEGRGWVEVVGESMPSDGQVVTTGQTQLADGAPVVVRAPEPAGGPAAESGAPPTETARTPPAQSVR